MHWLGSGNLLLTCQLMKSYFLFSWFFLHFHYNNHCSPFLQLWSRLHRRLTRTMPECYACYIIFVSFFPLSHSKFSQRRKNFTHASRLEASNYKPSSYSKSLKGEKVSAYASTLEISNYQLETISKTSNIHFFLHLNRSMPKYKKPVPENHTLLAV